MKKVICDVCGTAYTDTAEHCPICGCSKPVDQDAVSEQGDASYTYVKGGRFSKSNVRKRNKAAGISRQTSQEEDEGYYEEQQSDGTKGLMIAVILLALAIVAVIAYMVIFIFGGANAEPQQTQGVQQNPSQSQSTTVTTAPETTAPDLSCTDLELESAELVLMAAGDSVLINASVLPENTTDQLQYVSSDPAIATVTDEGRVTAVAPGEAQITVTCGSISASCKVVCDFAEETTEPELSGNYGMFIDNQNIENRRWKNEVTMSRGNTFRLEMKDLDTKEVLDVEWVLDKQNVVTISGNTVTAVANGTVRISYTVGDTTYTCIVRVTG